MQMIIVIENSDKIVISTPSTRGRVGRGVVKDLVVFIDEKNLSNNAIQRLKILKNK